MNRTLLLLRTITLHHFFYIIYVANFQTLEVQAVCRGCDGVTQRLSPGVMSVDLCRHWAAGPLSCWATGLLGHWAAGSLGCWVTGRLDHWAAGSLGCWVTEGSQAWLQAEVERREKAWTCQVSIHKCFNLFWWLFCLSLGRLLYINIYIHLYVCMYIFIYKLWLCCKPTVFLYIQKDCWLLIFKEPITFLFKDGVRFSRTLW